MLFHRLALSTDKDKAKQLSEKGQVIERPEDILKEPYVFEFAGLPQLPVCREGDIEDALVNNLGQFLLELGKGFAYIGRQQRIQIAGRIYLTACGNTIFLMVCLEDNPRERAASVCPHPPPW